MSFRSALNRMAGLLGHRWRLTLVAAAILTSLWLMLGRDPDLAPILFTLL